MSVPKCFECQVIAHKNQFSNTQAIRASKARCKGRWSIGFEILFALSKKSTILWLFLQLTISIKGLDGELLSPLANFM